MDSYQNHISCPYEQYYSHQAGSGIGVIYRGVPYQRGHGIGSFLGGLFRSILPLLSNGARAIGKEALNTGVGLLSDMVSARPMEDSIKTRLKEASSNLARKAHDKINKINMSGSGSLLLAAIVLSNCITWTTSRHHHKSNVNGHRSRHRRQGAGLFLPASYIIPGGEGSGAWGEWGEVSACSRTCGGGVAQQKRICLEVGPDGKSLCEGGDTKYFSCQTQDCPEDAMDFRTEQCAQYNNKSFNGHKYNWEPYTKSSKPCELICMPHSERFYVRHQPKVVDGTRCNDETYDICVNGVCQPVGCDMMLGSNAREDKCRQCRGNGTNCHTITGLDNSTDYRKGYNDVMLIPQGATNILIVEVSASNNYLALRAKTDNVYYLNGQYHIDYPGSFIIAGTLWNYERSTLGFPAPDKLRCLGPTNEALFLSLLLQDVNVGISYEYSVPSEVAPPPNRNYNWVHEEFSECNVTCGGGYQTRQVTCRSTEDLEIVDESLCDVSFKPATNQTCNTEACPPIWVEGPWGACSKACGSGGKRYREVYCEKIFTNGKTFRFSSKLADKECLDHLGPKPKDVEKCNHNATCPSWFIGPWLPCDKLCGEGKQTRQVICHQKINGRVELYDDKECPDEKPPTEQQCELHPCSGVDWVLSEWLGCDTCQSTVRTRTAHCVTNKHDIIDSKFCSYHPTPMLSEPCDLAKLPTCQVQWYATQWSNCSVICGKGVKTRKVFCGLFDGKYVTEVEDNRCDPTLKYKDEQECEIIDSKCPPTWYAGHWSKCTKPCGGGEQQRTIMCLNGGKELFRCPVDLAPDTTQPCNEGPCDPDEILPISHTSKILPNANDVVYCDEDYPEENAEALEDETIPTKMYEIFTLPPPTEEDEDYDLMGETGSGETDETTGITETESETSTDSWTGDTTDETTDNTLESSETTDDTLESSETTENTLEFSETTGTLAEISTSSSTDETITKTKTTESKVKSELKYLLDSESTDSSTDTWSADTDDTTNITFESSESTETDTIDVSPSSSTDDTTVETTESIIESTDTAETEPTEISASSGTDGITSETTEDKSPSTEIAETEHTETSISSSTDNDTYETTDSTIESSETTETGSSDSSTSGSPDTTVETIATTSKSSESSETATTEASASGSSEITTESKLESTETTEAGSMETSASSSTEIPSETTKHVPESSKTTDTGSTETSLSSSTDGITLETTKLTLESIETTESVSTEKSTSSSTETAEEEITGTTLKSSETIETTTSEKSSVSTSESSTDKTTDNTLKSSVSTGGEIEMTSKAVTDKTLDEASTGSIGISETTETVTTKTSTSTSTESSSDKTTEPTFASSETTSTEIVKAESSSGIWTDGSTERSIESSTPTEAVPVETSTRSSTDNITYEIPSSESSAHITEISASVKTTEAGSTNITLTDATTEIDTSVTESSTTFTIESTTAKDIAFSTTITESVSTEATEASSSISSGSESSITLESTTTVITESGPTESTIFSTTESSASTITDVSEMETSKSETPEFSTTESSTLRKNDTTTKSDEIQSTKSTYAGLTTLRTRDEDETSTSTPWNWDIITSTQRHCIRRNKTYCNSEFGCCPDKKTPATGPFDEGCSNAQTCTQTRFGCCPDGVSPADGFNYIGCPITPCNQTLFGCCKSDNVTAAEGNDQEGCPPPPPACKSSEFGCCIDEKTEAKGPEKEGCPETITDTTEQIASTTYSEQTTAAISTTDRIQTEPEGCETSEFGCCYDNETDASGPNGEGCPCSISEFGCCPDGITTAHGINLEGCVMSCNTSAYGCCSDGETPAHGPDHEGCCLQYHFGCCPDNYKPAEGPHLEGCGCQVSHFGCCPDNVTLARGPNNEGCGCQYTQFGCCPDRHTEAQGPEFSGCGCHTYQFGCCPDGVTVSTGPNLGGCLCQYSKYGCCGDEVTAAKGANNEGCDCSNSKYGCCPDGVTEAQGERFLNCSDVLEIKQAACSLASDRGPCSNYSVYWFYDVSYGGCTRFWYGGCEGNGNRFITEQECEDVCEHPSPKDACNLPKVKGACNGYHVRWYYDAAHEQCSQFVYGGCLGNANNFDTKELCQERCEPEKTEDQCNLEIEQGPCAGNFLRWGYNAQSRRCEQFIWGGCGGNTNRFSSEAACIMRCNPPNTPIQACSLPQDAGNCTEKHPAWFFRPSENRCMPFYYTGCGGNENRFDSEQACAKACPSAYVQEICSLPALTGICDQYTQRWFYDTTHKRCRQFYYGGCDGNENNFLSESECENRCMEQVTTPQPLPTVIPTTETQPEPAPEPALQTPPGDKTSEFCYLEIDSGPCTTEIQRWAYNVDTGSCMQFPYGGCGGNRNNFPTLEACAYYCPPAQDICQLPMLAGACDASLMRWFYDSSTDSCSQFTWSGCEGNRNRFQSLQECEIKCRTRSSKTDTTTVSSIDITPEPIPSECQVSLSLEECSGVEGEVWYLDTRQRACVSHNNPQVGFECRHTAVFPTQEACERSCGAFRGLDVCRYAMDPGPCTETQFKMYYDMASGRCMEFTYGGCHGGPNRFSSVEECEQVCLPATDICNEVPDRGNCSDYQYMWYYDRRVQDCGRFIYSGCSGNNNRFETREQCMSRCKKESTTVGIPYSSVTPSTSAPRSLTSMFTTTSISLLNRNNVDRECETPEYLEPCGNSVAVYYYDSRTQSCSLGYFGGCGYQNSYRTEEECERSCGAFKNLDVCSHRLDPGPCLNEIPKIYWDAVSGRCLGFTYGGCQGGPNRFSNMAECEEVCRSTGPEPACLQPVSTGEPGCGLPSRRWYYDIYGECLAFAYSGCGGTDNNFLSYEKCVLACKRASPAGCDVYNQECSALKCQYGVQRTRTAEGCERCVCDCTALDQECSRLECSYGIYRTTSEDGCARCSCNDDPCATKECPAGEYCVATPYRDPITMETRYSATCNELTNYVVPPNCDRYKEECAVLHCEYGIQRTRTADGCEHCVCVPVDVDCTLLRQDCDNLKCTYGLYKTTGDDGCERCRCIEDPCANKECPSGERCVTSAYRDPISLEVRYYTECRIVNKTGICPPRDAPSSATEGRCRHDCNNDADCHGVGKCCESGCSQLCLEPVSQVLSSIAPHTTYSPVVPHAPQVSNETEPEVHGSEGGKATLRCIFHSNPPPKITWRYGEVTIEGDVGRYRLLSDGALEIVSLYRNDTGVYICVADNGLGIATQEVRLEVQDPVKGPAGIVGIPDDVVEGQLGHSLSIRCLAFGFPRPLIYWYHGKDGPMVPYSSSLYEARENVLLIRKLIPETLGEYVCQAYNGLGKPAVWAFVVRAAEPSEAYVLPQPTVTLLTTQEPQTTPTTTAVYTVPVRTHIVADRTRLAAGSEINLPCEVDGYPVPAVYWTKDGVQISRMPSDRILVTEARLTILRANIEDSGMYGCHANNEYTSHQSFVQISVEGLYIPPNCKDSSYFADCKLIVRSKICHHHYYSRFCCKSCVEAGQLDPNEIEMQSDAGWRRK